MKQKSYRILIENVKHNLHELKLKDLLVENSLETTHLTLDDVLGLLRQLRLDVLLQTTKQERTKDFVKTTDDQNSFFLVQLNLNKIFINNVKNIFEEITCIYGEIKYVR